MNTVGGEREGSGSDVGLGHQTVEVRAGCVIARAQVRHVDVRRFGLRCIDGNSRGRGGFQGQSFIGGEVEPCNRRKKNLDHLHTTILLHKWNNDAPWDA